MIIKWFQGDWKLIISLKFMVLAKFDIDLLFGPVLNIILHLLEMEPRRQIPV